MNNELRNFSDHSLVKENVKEVYLKTDCYYLTTDNNLYKLTSNQEQPSGQNVKKAVGYDEPVGNSSVRPTLCYITNDNKLFVIGLDKSYNNVSDAFPDGTYLGLDKKLYRITDGTEIADNVEKYVDSYKNNGVFHLYYVNTSRQLVEKIDNRSKYNC